MHVVMLKGERAKGATRIRRRTRSSERARCRRSRAAENRCSGIFGARTGHRSYNPDTGRWLNRDPLGEDGHLRITAPRLLNDARGWAGYVLALNDPVNRVDIDGRDSIDSVQWAKWQGRGLAITGTIIEVWAISNACDALDNDESMVIRTPVSMMAHFSAAILGIGQCVCAWAVRRKNENLEGFKR